MILALALSAAIAATGCGPANTGENTTSSTTASNSAGETTTASDNPESVTTTTQQKTDQVIYTAGEYTAVPDSVSIPTSGNTIVFERSSIEAKGNGMTVDGNTVTITSAGIYTISGTLDDGKIIVNATNDGNVVLALYGVTMYCSSSAPIYVENADSVIIKLIDETISSISDNSSYTYADATETDPNAAIFSKDALTFTGNGTLIVNGNYKNAISCKDDLIIESGSYQISSIEDGIIGKDSVLVKSGAFTIKAGIDGIKANNYTDADKGTITIKDGTFNIEATNDGIQAETTLTIDGGSFDFTTGGGSANASSGDNNNDWGNWTMDPNTRLPMSSSADTSDETLLLSSSDTTESTSAKGLKGLTSIVINGGTFNLDTSDDALHSNGTIVINNGTFNIASGDDGIHADEKLTINNCTMDITKSYEGLESSAIELTGGNIKLVSSDDGINVAGGNDSSGFMRPGQQSDYSSGTDNYYLTISGGYLYMNAGGDGLDSNGTITMTGGEVYVDGPVNNGNGAIDYQNAFNISGGILVAVGSSGMAEPPSNTSTQNTIAITTSYSAGDIITLKNSAGETIFTYTVSKTAGSAIISTAQIKTGETYTAFTNDTDVGNVTVSGSVSYIGGSGGWFGGGGGGGMNPPSRR